MSKLTTDINIDADVNLNYGLCYWDELSEISSEEWFWIANRISKSELYRNNLSQETWD